ncbi:MAG: LVIVD repeat-containing protein [Candidatus Xenobiia bacterium LiM19]
MKDRIVCALLILTVMMFSIAGSAAQAGEITLSYVNSYLWNNIRDMEICGHLLYCAYVNGLKILDVSTPSKPRTISTTPIKGGAADIYLQGTYAWLATEHNGIAVIDTSSARNPRIAATIDEKASSIDGKQGFLFCTCGKSGLKAYTAGNPGSPELVGIYNPEGFSIDKVRLKGNQAFVTLAEGEKPHTLALIDISDPHDIREISRCAIVSDSSQQSIDFGIVDLAVKDDTVFLVDRTKGILVVDVSDPHFPVKLPYVPLLDMYMGNMHIL